MNSKVAKLAEHHNITLPDIVIPSCQGELPAYCDKCTGFLDFKRKNNKTILKCRECGKELDLD